MENFFLCNKQRRRFFIVYQLINFLIFLFIHYKHWIDIIRLYRINYFLRLNKVEKKQYIKYFNHFKYEIRNVNLSVNYSDSVKNFV